MQETESKKQYRNTSVHGWSKKSNLEAIDKYLFIDCEFYEEVNSSAGLWKVVYAELLQNKFYWIVTGHVVFGGRMFMI